MKKVYLVSYHGLNNAGGVERVMQYFFKILAVNYEVIVLDKEKILANRLFGCLYRILPYKFWELLYPWINGIYLKLNKKPTDIIIANGFNTQGIKVDLLVAHGSIAGVINNVYGRKFAYTALYEKLAGHKATKILAVSKLVVKEWCKFYKLNKNKFIVINNCVDSYRFKPYRVNDKIKIIYVGRLEVGKNMYELQTLAQKIEDLVDYHLTIITNNINNVELFQGLKNTTLKVGLNLDEIQSEYAKHDIMFFSSRYEGFEMVTLEALSSGIPVLGNKVGAIGELYDKEFPGVYLINHKQEIVTQITEIANQYKEYNQRMILHNKIAETFSIENYASQIQQILGSSAT